MSESAPPTWSVSTLIPGLHGQPKYKYFDNEHDALQHARDQARRGPRYRKGGKGRVYYVMDIRGGHAQFRVFRGLQQLEVRSGTSHGARREYVVVQVNGGVVRGTTDRTRWLFDKARSVEIIDIEAESDAKRRAPAKPRQKIRGEYY